MLFGKKRSFMYPMGQQKARFFTLLYKWKWFSWLGNGCYTGGPGKFTSKTKHVCTHCCLTKNKYNLPGVSFCSFLMLVSTGHRANIMVMDVFCPNLFQTCLQYCISAICILSKVMKIWQFYYHTKSWIKTN